MNLIKKIALATVAISMSLALHAKEWHDVKVTKAGKAQSGAYFLYLTDQNEDGALFEKKLFRLAEGVGPTGLAIGLEGIGGQYKVRIFSNVDTVGERVPFIYAIYLTDEQAN